MVKQISIFVENNPGRLAELCRLLSDNSINMCALTLVDAEEFGIVRILVSDVYAAVTVLKDNAYICKIRDVIVAELSNERGSLAQILDAFHEKALDVEYMYAFTNHKDGKANMAFALKDPAAGSQVLAEHGVRRITQDEIAAM